jgi:beta-barrel assembly-enhancing protease
VNRSSLRRPLFRCATCCVLICLGLPLWAVEPEFRFDKPDLTLLEEANQIDQIYARKGLIVTDSEITGYVESVGNKLVANQPAPQNVTFKFRIIRDPIVNAYALPNGSIYVTTGLIARLQNEAQLAGVLSHEITHVTGRHGYLHNRNMRKKMVVIDIFQGAAAAGGAMAQGAANASNAAVSAAQSTALLKQELIGMSLQATGQLGQAVMVASIFGYSREQEREADDMGINRMVAAGYDPHAIPQALGLLDEHLEYEPIITFYRDHPKTSDRVGETTKLADAQPGTAYRTYSESDYLAKFAPVIVYNIRADLSSRRERTALARTQRLLAWKPDDLSYQTLMADCYRGLGAKSPEPSAEELTRHGVAEDRKLYFQHTAVEEQQTLRSKADGQAQLKSNQQTAEQTYVSVIGRDSSKYDAYLGLGFLYEEEDRKAEAAQQYQQFLKIAAPDNYQRLRIQRRLENLEKSLPPASAFSVTQAAAAVQQ